MTGNEKTQTQLMSEALELLQRSITLLDQAEAPGQIAAHLDLAAHQLSDAIADGPGLRSAQPELGTLPTS